jgi:hypothetical protein
MNIAETINLASKRRKRSKNLKLDSVEIALALKQLGVVQWYLGEGLGAALLIGSFGQLCMG